MPAIRQLWPHQVEGIDQADAAKERSVVVCAPTGSGKTVMQIELARRVVDRGGRAMFMVPRNELVLQTSQKLDEWAPFGYGMIVADKASKQNLYLPIQLCSVDTLVSRVVKRKNLVLPPTDLVLIDEAHLYQTELRSSLLDCVPQAKIVGFTATPARFDGRSLGSLFERIIEVGSIPKLIESGVLVRARHISPQKPDLDGIPIKMGEYVQAKAAERMQPLIGGIIPHWLKFAPDRRTVVFTSRISHSIWLTEEFQRAGITAEHADSNMDPQMRNGVFERFRSGETQVLCNVELATYGFDLPEISCVVIARLTRSVVKYLQMIGRGSRSAQGKHDFLIIDHAGMYQIHGRFEDERYWSLEGSDRSTWGRPDKDGNAPRKPPKLLCCPKCTYVFSGAFTCPECGHFFAQAAKEFKVIEGELVEIDKEAAEKIDWTARINFFLEMRQYAIEKNYKDGWASYAYKERYEDWPPKEWRDYKPRPISITTKRYIQHMWIRKRKAREAEAKRAQNQG